MDGLEALALAFGWPPSVGRDLSLDEWPDWVARAQRALTARHARG